MSSPRLHMNEKRAEENARRERDLAENLIDTAQTIVLLLDPEGRIVKFNRYMEELCGYALHEVRGKDWVETFIPERKRDTIRSLFLNATHGTQTKGNVNAVVAKDGSERLVEWFDSTIKNEKNEVMGLLSTGQDVTERVRAHQERDEAIQRLNLALKAANVGLWDYYPLENRVVFSDQWKRQLGFERDEFPDEPDQWFARIHADDQDRVIRYLGEFISGGGHGEYSIEFRLLHRDEKYRWMLARGSAIERENGHVTRMLGSHIDITERKRAEQELSFLSEIVRQTPDGIVCTDTNYRTIYANDAVKTLFGWSLEELMGKSPTMLFASTPGKEVQSKMARTLSAGNVFEIEALNRRKDGTTFDCHFRVAPLFDQEGTLTGYMGSQRDVTEHNSMRNQLAQSDRLASMGMLAAGVAHEINNPLSYVLYNLESLSEDLPRLDSALRKCLDVMTRQKGDNAWQAFLGSDLEMLNPSMLTDIIARFKDALEGTVRIKDVARGLGTFSRVEDNRRVSINLTHVIEVAINMVFNEIKYRARLVKEYGKTSSVMASDGRLSQVFLNLLINAAHAIGEGDVESNEIRVRTWQDGDEVFAEIRDTGKGIPPENLPSLFEPFFTTKEAGVGTGLGLPISKNIIEGYGGRIEVKSEVGTGTSFIVRLPVYQAADQVEDGVQEREADAEPIMKGRILVVDDEAGIRSAMVRMLRGHDVVEAVSGEEARKILEADQAFDLILCDMMMPAMSGAELHEWLVAKHPALAKQVVFITGGAFTPKAREYLAKVSNIHLEKPIDVVNFKKITRDRIFISRQRVPGTDSP